MLSSRHYNEIRFRQSLFDLLVPGGPQGVNDIFSTYLQVISPAYTSVVLYMIKSQRRKYRPSVKYELPPLASVINHHVVIVKHTDKWAQSHTENQRWDNSLDAAILF